MKAYTRPRRGLLVFLLGAVGWAFLVCYPNPAVFFRNLAHYRRLPLDLQEEAGNGAVGYAGARGVSARILAYVGVAGWYSGTSSRNARIVLGTSPLLAAPTRFSRASSIS